MPAVLRIGRGGAEIDNAHSGGMFIGISNNGVLSERAMTEFMTVFYEHPDSGVAFNGYKINRFPEVLKSALKMHAMIPELGAASWDFTIDEEGMPTLIEVNLLNGGFWIIQCAHSKAPFGEFQPEILMWMKRMNKMPLSKREKFAFGF